MKGIENARKKLISRSISSAEVTNAPLNQLSSCNFQFSICTLHFPIFNLQFCTGPGASLTVGLRPRPALCSLPSAFCLLFLRIHPIIANAGLGNEWHIQLHGIFHLAFQRFGDVVSFVLRTLD